MAVGSFLWFVHCVSILLGTAIMMRVDIGDLHHQWGVVQTAFVAYVAATVVVSVAGFLIGIGLFAYRRGIRNLRSPEGMRTVRHRTRSSATGAAACFVAYGLVAAIGLTQVVEMWSQAGSGHLFPVLQAAISALVTWLVASAFLIVGTILYSLFLRFLRFDSGTREPLVGSEFLAYSITNPMGIPFLIGAVALGLADRNVNLPADVAPILVVAPMQLIAMPTIGIVLILATLVVALRLRKV